jgi:hypothetical protein
LFTDVHFSQLPSALDAVVEAAETTLPEEVTFRAGLAALALHRWGFDTATILEGYRHGAALPLESVLSKEGRAAIRLADWVARLHQDPFDLTRWKAESDELANVCAFPRLMPIGGLCFPTEALNRFSCE